MDIGTVYYTRTQTFITTLSRSLSQNFGYLQKNKSF